LNKTFTGKSSKKDADKTLKKEETLKKISRELLKGSILLQESCPACKMPLVLQKNKNNPKKQQMWCISCDMPVIRESEIQNHMLRANARKTGGSSNITISDLVGLDGLISIVTGKLESQIQKLAEEEELAILKARTEVAERLANLLRMLRELTP
jgi:uncharacterized Zn finger protein (UPF0148 family)